MKENDIHSELASIRTLMERSTKFFSLSGLAGVMAGIYALIGSYIGYYFAYQQYNTSSIEGAYANNPQVYEQLVLVGIAILVLSIITAILLTMRQAKKKDESFWNPVSRRLLFSMSVPLATGGLFIIILLLHSEYDIIAAATLMFYGLSLVSGSQYTFSDVKWLGFSLIVLGLIAACIPEYGFLLWTIGFGLLHIIYGSAMHIKYNK